MDHVRRRDSLHWIHALGRECECVWVVNTFRSVPCACVLVSPLYYKPSVNVNREC